jgi:hypothetical protein
MSTRRRALRLRSPLTGRAILTLRATVGGITRREELPF